MENDAHTGTAFAQFLHGFIRRRKGHVLHHRANIVRRREPEHAHHGLGTTDDASCDTLLLVEERVHRKRERLAWHTDETERALEGENLHPAIPRKRCVRRHEEEVDSGGRQRAVDVQEITRTELEREVAFIEVRIERQYLGTELFRKANR